jgi:hypothetical protein
MDFDFGPSDVVSPDYFLCIKALINEPMPDAISAASGAPKIGATAQAQRAGFVGHHLTQTAKI